MRKRIMVVFGALLLVSLACGVTINPTPTSGLSNNSQGNGDQVATSVAATMAANAEAPNQPSQGEAQGSTPEQPQAPVVQAGTVEGHVCYPSEFIPAMTVYLEKVGDQTTVEIPIPLNGGNFSQQVTPGTYKAYAWLPDFTYGGSYTPAVACGLSVNCNDHSLIEFSVMAGQTASDVFICDWYGGPDSVPMPPGVDLSAYTGSITGTLGYPSEYIPAMYIVAFNTNTTFWYYVQTTQNANSYQIDGLPPGPYQVVAYVIDGGLSGGYTQAVPCGLSINCNDHSLITVMVTAGGLVTDANPIDFYAQPGDFPPNPVP